MSISQSLVKPINLYLFFPYKEVGGVQVLFLNLARKITSISNEFNVHIIDYKDGYLASNLSSIENIYLEVYDSEKQIHFEDTDIVLFQSMILSKVPSNLNFSNGTKLVFWNLHPHNLGGDIEYISKRINNSIVRALAIKAFKLLFYRNEKAQIKKYLKKNSIRFMDGANLSQTEKYFGIKIPNSFLLPLLLDEGVMQVYKPMNTISAIWLGRLCDFKVHILVYTMHKLSKTCTSANFTIVGDGAMKDYVKEEAKKIHNIKFKFIDYIAPKDLKDTITNHNIGFAMGTSALDLAKHGLPTVCLNFSHSKINNELDYIYTWLYNTKDYNLGEQINDTHFKDSDQSLNNILYDVLNNFEERSSDSYAFVRDVFNSNKVINDFISFIKSSCLIYSDLHPKHFEYSLFQRIRGTDKAHSQWIR